MSEGTYYRLSLLLPIAVPLLFRPFAGMVEHPVGWIAEFLWWSLLIGGVPYAILAVGLLRWMQGRSDRECFDALTLAPLYGVGIGWLCGFLSTLVVGFQGAAFGALGGTIVVPLIGYIYVLVMVIGRNLLRACGILYPSGARWRRQPSRLTLPASLRFPPLRAYAGPHMRPLRRRIAALLCVEAAVVGGVCWMSVRGCAVSDPDAYLAVPDAAVVNDPVAAWDLGEREAMARLAQEVDEHDRSATVTVRFGNGWETGGDPTQQGRIRYDRRQSTLTCDIGGSVYAVFDGVTDEAIANVDAMHGRPLDLATFGARDVRR